MKLYYRIWVDCISRLRSIDINKNNWKLTSMFAMSVAMTFNFVLFMSVFQKEVLGYYFYEFNIPNFTGYENYISTILVLYFLPCIIINYLLILHGKRYEKLLEKYPYKNGKLFATYFTISLFLPIILIFIGIFLFRI